MEQTCRGLKKVPDRLLATAGAAAEQDPRV